MEDNTVFHTLHCNRDNLQRSHAGVPCKGWSRVHRQRQLCRGSLCEACPRRALRLIQYGFDFVWVLYYVGLWAAAGSSSRIRKWVTTALYCEIQIVFRSLFWNDGWICPSNFLLCLFLRMAWSEISPCSWKAFGWIGYGKFWFLEFEKNRKHRFLLILLTSSHLLLNAKFQKDLVFIGFNKLATAPFVYFFLRYAYFEQNVVWDLHNITLVCLRTTDGDDKRSFLRCLYLNLVLPVILFSIDFCTCLTRPIH